MQNGVMHTTKAQRLERALLTSRLADRTTYLSDFQLTSHLSFLLNLIGVSPTQPSNTFRNGMPRRLATSSGSSSCFSASIVALTWLCGLLEPSDFDRMSV